MISIPGLKRKLGALGIVVEKVTPGDDLVDASIDLGGAHKGVHLSVGDGYYSVVREMSDEKFLFVDGAGNLAAEIQAALLP